MGKQIAFIDTNYFLSLLLDRAPQSNKVREFIKDAHTKNVELFTNEIVLFEIKWVLATHYNKSKLEVITLLEKILSLSVIKIKNKKIFSQALDIHKINNLELEDCYNLAYAQKLGASHFKTFDKKLAKCWNITKSVSQPYER